MMDLNISQRKTSAFNLIINADDVGYSQTRDEGIVECIDSGSVTSCSLLVNAVSAKSVVTTRSDEISLGLHLNLTEGCPIGSTYDTLTNEKGFFRGKFGFREAISSGQIDFEEISEEIGHQIRIFGSLTGQKPVHIDGHQHIHIIPDVMKILAPQMASNEINITRIPHEKHLTSCSWLSETSSFFQSVIRDSLQSQDICLKNGIYFPDEFLGLSTMGYNMSARNLEERFHTVRVSLKDKQLKNAETAAGRSPWFCELMVHPGYVTNSVGGCGEGPDDFSQSKDRQHEMNILKEMNSMNFYEKNNINLTSFKTFFPHKIT